MSPERANGDGHPVSQYFWAFVLWRLSLAVCCASSESQSSSGLISASVSDQRDCDLFSIDVLATLTLFLLVLLNPAASGAVRPTPSVPALTSRASVSLSFVFLIPPAALRALHAEALPLSLVEALPLSLVASIPAQDLSLLSRRCVHKSARSPMQVATASRRPKAAAPSPFHLSSISVRGFRAPRFVPQYSALEMFICRDPDVSSCVSG